MISILSSRALLARANLVERFFPLSFEGSRPKLHAGAKGERGALICLKAKMGVLSKLTVGGGRYADLEACGGR